MTSQCSVDNKVLLFAIVCTVLFTHACHDLYTFIGLYIDRILLLMV